jgi:hypothetical protein
VIIVDIEAIGTFYALIFKPNFKMFIFKLINAVRGGIAYINYTIRTSDDIIKETIVVCTEAMVILAVGISITSNSLISATYSVFP